MSRPAPKVGDVLITTEAFFDAYDFHAIFTVEQLVNFTNLIPEEDCISIVEDTKLHPTRMAFYLSEINKYFVNIS